MSTIRKFQRRTIISSPESSVEEEVQKKEEWAGPHEEESGHPEENGEGLHAAPEGNVDGCKLWPVTDAQVEDTGQRPHHPWQPVKGVTGCMEGWEMYKRMDGWLDGGLGRWKERTMVGWMSGWREGNLRSCTEEQIDRWMEMDGWMDGWAEGWREGRRIK